MRVAQGGRCVSLEDAWRLFLQHVSPGRTPAAGSFAAAWLGLRPNARELLVKRHGLKDGYRRTYAELAVVFSPHTIDYCGQHVRRSERFLRDRLVRLPAERTPPNQEAILACQELVDAVEREADALPA